MAPLRWAADELLRAADDESVRNFESEFQIFAPAWQAAALWQGAKTLPGAGVERIGAGAFGAHSLPTPANSAWL